MDRVCSDLYVYNGCKFMDHDAAGNDWVVDAFSEGSLS